MGFSGAYIPVRPRGINLEHILPKKPENNWSAFTDEEVSLYVNRIGNMALLQASKNADLRSDGFDVKKSMYRQSPYVLTKQISEEDKWDKNSIIHRQKVLAEYALKAWKT